MPTANPRLSVTLKPSIAAILRELSELTGNSQSALVAELLEEGEPVFVRMIRVLRAAQEASQTVRTSLADSMASVQGRLEDQLGLALGAMEGYESELLEDAEKVARRRGRSTGRASGAGSGTAAGTALPPISNRGVTPLKKAKKKQAGGSAKKAAGGRSHPGLAGSERALAKGRRGSRGPI